MPADLEAGVNFDARDNSLLAQDVNKGRAACRALVQGLLKHDGTCRGALHNLTDT